MRFAYYPGCSLSSSGYDFNLSFKYVAKTLGMDLVEVRDWVCCGASSGHSTSHLTSVALPALTLAHAEQDGFEKLIAPCLACLARCKAANLELEHDPELREKIHEVLDYRYQGKVKAYHPLEVFLEIGIEKIKEAITSIQDDFEKILVITHIADFKDAFPMRIEVVKTPEGSTIYLN